MKRRDVQIVLADRGWILERCANELASRLDYVSVGEEPSRRSPVLYYFPYTKWTRRIAEVELAFYTHLEPFEATRHHFFRSAQQMDACVSLSRMYAQQLREAAARKVVVISPGIDLERYSPRLRIGVVGRTYHTGRKGEDILRAVMDLPGIDWQFVGEGWPGECKSLEDEAMPDFYRSLDYLLVPSLYEGGPMPAIEALACGTPVISGAVGVMPDLPHREFKAGDAADLRRVLLEALDEKRALHETVAERSWAGWADSHDQLFEQLERVSRESSSASRKLRIFFSTDSSEEVSRGGPTIRMRQTARALRSRGHDVVIGQTLEAQSGDFDIVHIFNSWPLDSCRERIAAAKERRLPVVLSPIFMDHAEWRAMHRLIRKAYGSRRFSPSALMARRELQSRKRRRRAARQEPIDDPYRDGMADLMSRVDHVILLSQAELAALRRIGAEPRSFSFVWNTLDPEPYDLEGLDDAWMNLLGESSEIGEYVICVGRIEERKNQLMLLQAMRDQPEAVVLVGQALDPSYDELVSRASGKRVYRIDHIESESRELVSALAGAKAFVLPSWIEGSPLAALEAAAVGVPIVLGDRGGSREYFGDLARYCEPGDPKSIRKAIRKAIDDDSPELAHRRRSMIHTRFHSRRGAEETEQAYFRAIAEAQR